MNKYYFRPTYLMRDLPLSFLFYSYRSHSALGSVQLEISGLHFKLENSLYTYQIHDIYRWPRILPALTLEH